MFVLNNYRLPIQYNVACRIDLGAIPNAPKASTGQGNGGDVPSQPIRGFGESRKLPSRADDSDAADDDDSTTNTLY